MHGLGVETDLAPLVGCTLTFVGFGEWQLQLAFTGEPTCSIAVEGDYVVARPDGGTTRCRRAVDGAEHLLALLGRTVVQASVPEDGSVRLRFDDGSMVDVLDSHDHHESYQVRIGNRLLVV